MFGEDITQYVENIHELAKHAEVNITGIDHSNIRYVLHTDTETHSEIWRM